MDQVVKFFGFFLFAHVRTFNFKNFGIVHYTGFRQIWFVTQNPFFNRKSGLSFSAFRRLVFRFRHFHNFFCQMALFSNLYNLFSIFLSFMILQVLFWQTAKAFFLGSNPEIKTNSFIWNNINLEWNVFNIVVWILHILFSLQWVFIILYRYRTHSNKYNYMYILTIQIFSFNLTRDWFSFKTSIKWVKTC